MTLEFPSDSSFLDLLSIEAEVRNWLITEWVDVSAPTAPRDLCVLAVSWSWEQLKNYKRKDLSKLHATLARNKTRKSRESE